MTASGQFFAFTRLGEILETKYRIQELLEVPEQTCKNWQLIVDLLARQLGIPAALIMRVHAEEIEVFMASRSDGNVYHHGEKARLNTGLYCETVMDTGQMLMVPDALNDPHWQDNPDVPLGMISYLGLPLSWPTGDVFGTLCILDSKKNTFEDEHVDLLRLFQESVMLNLSVIYEKQRESALREQAEGALKKSESYVRTLIDSSPDLIWLKNERHVYLACNKKFERYIGATENEITGKTDADFLDAPLADLLRQRDDESIQRGASSIDEEEIVYADDGHKEILETIRTPIYDKNSKKLIGVLGVARDITARKSYEQQIYQRAYYDELTGLPNRFYILDCLSKLIAESKRNGKRVALLFIDLDDFKKVNDTLGHEAGDHLLVQATQRLKGCLRGSDTVGRLGGDEFIVLLNGLMRPCDATLVAENLLRQFQAPFVTHGHELVLTASIGLSTYPDNGLTASELLRNSDTAMYHAKEQGRNTYSCYADTMNQSVFRRLQIEEQMRSALARRELRLNYQPIVQMPSGQMIGVEALLRWTNASLGEIGPDEFISVAEHSGMIVDIGRFVLQEALGQYHHWRKASGLDSFRISINISPRQLRETDFADMLDLMLKAAQVPPQCIELEITEGVLMTGYAEIGDVLASLHRLGVSIAMDDFGKGYSSLSYLRSYPFSTLKIDREFICEIDTKPSDLKLVNGIVMMAHGMGLRVVAEGVEAVEQLTLLEGLSCDLAQGYYLSRPVPAGEISTLLEASQPQP